MKKRVKRCGGDTRRPLLEASARIVSSGKLGCCSSGGSKIVVVVVVEWVWLRNGGGSNGAVIVVVISAERWIKPSSLFLNFMASHLVVA